MFKTETHLHVSEVSTCSRLRAAEMMKLYHEAGYKTVFVSDHFNQGLSATLGDLSWEDKITIFLSGYFRAKVAGEKLQLNVLLSAEFAFENSPNHYLAYGITREFLNSYPELSKLSPEDFCKIARENNIFIVQAHPYRDGKCFPTPGIVDAIEIYNSNPRHEDFSDKAKKCAGENGLYVTSGSDAHRIDDAARGGILSKKEIKTADDYINLIKSGEFRIYKGCGYDLSDK